ncbi:hypothetical protein [Streptomyces tauricus]
MGVGLMPSVNTALMPPHRAVTLGAFALRAERIRRAQPSGLPHRKRLRLEFRRHQQSDDSEDTRQLVRVAKGGPHHEQRLSSPGSDHIQATWVAGGRTFDRRLHFNPGPGEYKITFGPQGVELKSLTWRGEC